jgi:hexosaminidase
MRNVLMLFLCLPIVFLFSCRYEGHRIKTVQIIPQPVQVKQFENKYFKVSRFVVQSDPALQNINEYFNLTLQNILYLPVEDSSGIETGIINLSLDKTFKYSEGYRLDISNNMITIKGRDLPGVFYGIQSLLQLISANRQKNKEIDLPILSITDYPRFEWRGMHLDVSRHFFSKEFIKKYIDVLAMHKLNIFHWHLTDDQGWRIEIKKYPKLVKLGAWRKGTGMEEWTYFVEPKTDSGPNYGGYYTREDIREIVAYAADRFVTIIPEIELPGHSWSALYAYAEYSCSGKPWKKPDDVVFEFSDPFCAGNDKTFEFFENVLSEVIELFPSEYIHIGGDEAKKIPWEHCPKCQQRMKTENLHDVKELQSYFIKRIENFVRSKGRKIIGWDEIMEGGLAPGAAVMSWRGEQGGFTAARAGHPVVMVPSEYLYFNRAQIDEKAGIGGLTALERVYNYNPLPDSLSKEQMHNIMGAQAALWTENVYTEQQAEEKTLPRLSALSEIVWAPEDRKDWYSFMSRLDNHLVYLETFGYNYFVPPPFHLEDDLFIEHEFVVMLQKPYSSAKVHYTLDGSTPTEQSPVYSEPIVLNTDTHIKALTIMPSGKYSRVQTAIYKKGILQDGVPESNFTHCIKMKLLTGVIQSLDDISTLNEIGSSVVQKIEIPANVPEDHFALVFEGYINVLANGIYTFYTESDDGSRLFINHQLVIDNDGIHAPQQINGKAALKKGFHRLRIEFFEGNYGQVLKVYFKGPGIEKQDIPESLLFH